MGMMVERLPAQLLRGRLEGPRKARVVQEPSWKALAGGRASRRRTQDQRHLDLMVMPPTDDYSPAIFLILPVKTETPAVDSSGQMIL
mmetsp:Transcript_5152/g.14413  ORF Transcript_5152/g.14413 Transcript_5152/m.14413 type:complete len:87 (+) Transcript_5152:837-1097(+)